MTEKEKQIVLVTGATVCLYGVLRPSPTYEAFKTNRQISMCGAAFAILPYVLDIKIKNVEIKGASIKYRFGKKKYKCYSGYKNN